MNYRLKLKRLRELLHRFSMFTKSLSNITQPIKCLGLT